MDNQKLFESLVRNGIDFLESAIEQIENKPKYSIIHFYSAIEILFKARLLLEHWALTWEKPQQANQVKFLAGDFRSVSLEDAENRISAISRDHLRSSAMQSFKRLRHHRNQLIHFFHPEYQDNPSDEVVAAVVADLCTAWFHLHKLLIGNWDTEFSDYSDVIQDLDNRMMRIRPYLEVRYESLKESIERGRRGGTEFKVCRSCGFDSAKINRDYLLIETDCLVCLNSESWLEIECPECGETIQVIELGSGTCANCGTNIDMDYLVNQLVPEHNPRRAPDDPACGYCPNCEWTDQQSVVPWEDHYLCLNCFEPYDYISVCEWCNEKNAGNVEDSYLYGCVLCEGRFGWGA